MDVESGESKEEEVLGVRIGEWEMEDEEIKEADSRDQVKHNERSDQLFLERMMSLAEQE